MDEERRSKMRLLKIGVGLTMVFILAFWSFNFRNIWNRHDGPVVKNQENWQEIRNGFDESISDLETRLELIGQAQKKAADESDRAFMADLIRNTVALASSTVRATSSVGLSDSAASSSEAAIQE